MEAYYDFPTYCKNTFGRKLYRVAIHAGMTCPNRDGTIGTGGCIFCDGEGSGDFAIRYNGEKLEEKNLTYNHIKAGEGNYIAYFQAFTNTYAPVERLRKLYEGVLCNDLFAGISIGTRADCLGEDVIALLKEMKEKYPDKFIWVELGLQTMHDSTAEVIRRGYPLRVFDAAVKNLHAIGIDVIVHVILGLPQENEKMVIETIEHLNLLEVEGVKLQLLHFLKGTELGRMYEEEEVCALSEERYIEMVCMCVGHLKPHIVIHRITGDGASALLLAPAWARNKRGVINRIRHELKVKGIYQGSLRK